MVSLEMPQNHLGNGQSDFIEINVGGRVFACSRITLTSFSGYFASMLSKSWKSDGDNSRNSAIHFIDQDPDAFQILLSYMRNGFIKASSISEIVLVQAEFLGIDSLIQAIKCSSYRYLHNHHSQNLQEEKCCHCFDQKYGGILSAVQLGILPRSIQPSVRGHKEYAHLGISNDAVVIQTSIPDSDRAFLPCLMTKLILPSLEDSDQTIIRTSPSEESLSSTATEQPYCFPTLIESLNWLHRNGYVEEDKSNDFLLHCCADIYNQQPIDPRMIQLFGHIWFSRRVVAEDDSDATNRKCVPHWQSPILYDQKSSKTLSSSFMDRREFAALVSLYPDYQGDELTREFVVAEATGSADILNRLKVIDDAADVGFTTSRTMYIHGNNENNENPVQWLATQGYTRMENEYSKLLQQLYREGSSKAYLWDNETLSRIHVRVFSRDLVE